MYTPPPPFGRSHRLGLPMVVFVEWLPADKPWDVVSVTHRSSGVAPRACVRVYARVLVPPNLYIHTYIYVYTSLSYKESPGTHASTNTSNCIQRIYVCIHIFIDMSKHQGFTIWYFSRRLGLTCRLIRRIVFNVYMCVFIYS